MKLDKRCFIAILISIIIIAIGFITLNFTNEKTEQLKVCEKCNRVMTVKEYTNHKCFK